MSYAQYRQSSQKVFLYGHPDTIRYKFQIRSGGLYQLLWAAVIWIMWGAQKLPTLPEYWYSFAAIYYTVIAPIWIINIWMGDSRSKDLFVIAGFANAIVMAVISFATGLVWYNLYLCWFGYLPLTCRNSGLPNLLAAIFSSFLWANTLDVFTGYLMIIGRIIQTRSVKGIRFPNSPPAQDYEDYEEDYQ